MRAAPLKPTVTHLILAALIAHPRANARGPVEAIFTGDDAAILLWSIRARMRAAPLKREGAWDLFLGNYHHPRANARGPVEARIFLSSPR